MVHFALDLGTGCGQKESHIFMSAPLHNHVYQGAPEVTSTKGLFILQIARYYRAPSPIHEQLIELAVKTAETWQ